MGLSPSWSTLISVSQSRVDMMTKGRDETKGLVIITVHCHGATERVELEDEILEDQYGKNISFTEAFRARK
jgi:DNA-binding protein YbaB